MPKTHFHAAGICDCCDAPPEDVLDLRLEIEETERILDRPVTVDSPNAREYRADLLRTLDDLYAQLRKAEATP